MNTRNWYYEQAGQQKGPVSEATLRGLLADEVIPPSTLVWREGMANWQPAAEVLEAPLAANIKPPPLPLKEPVKPAIHGIKKTPVILVVIFTVITAGIYCPCWFLTRRASLNSLKAREKLGNGVFIFAIVVFSVSLLLSFISGGLEGLGEAHNDMEFIAMSKGVDAVAGMISLVAGIPLLVQCFKVRRMLREHFTEHLGRHVPFSGVALFFFQIFYLQYKINQL